MSLQHRPLSGMVVGGVAAPQLVDNVAPTVLHKVDVLPAASGGPFMDQVTLYVQNPTNGALDFTLTALGGAAMKVTVASKALATLVLDQIPFQAAQGATSGTGTQITGQGSAAGLVFYGWFARIG